MSAEPTNFVEIIRKHVLDHPNSIAYTFLEDGENKELHLTYRELDYKARLIAGNLQKVGQVGDRALLLYPSSLEYITAFVGCLYAGITAVPVYPPPMNKPDSRLSSIAENSDAKFILTTKKLLDKSKSRSPLYKDFASRTWLATDDLSLQLLDSWQPIEQNLETVAFLQYTSGSTSIPKGVMVTHGNIIHNEKMMQNAFDFNTTTTTVAWLPFFHDMGLIGIILQSLYNGSRTVFMTPIAFLQKPFRWLKAISKYKGYFCGGPNFGYDYCTKKITDEELAKLDLSHWKVAFNGSEPVRAKTLKNFTERFAAAGFKKEVFYPCYGMAEATLFVAGGNMKTAPFMQSFDSKVLEQNVAIPAWDETSKNQELVSCGQSQLDQEVVIVDPESQNVCKGVEIGEIWLTGDSVAKGYWNLEKESQETFGNTLPAYGDKQFLRTGDLGFIHQNELFITGRIKDMIIIRGNNFYPQDIEMVVQEAHPAIRPGSIAAFAIVRDDEERLVIMCEIKKDQMDVDFNLVGQAISNAIAREFEVELYALAALPPTKILKTTSGKIQRNACRKAYQDDSLEFIFNKVLLGAQVAVQAEVSDTPQDEGEFNLNVFSKSIVDHAQKFLERRGSSARVTPASNLQNDLGLDSLSRVDMISDIESRVGVALDPDDIGDIETIHEMIDLFEEANKQKGEDGGEKIAGIDEMRRKVLEQIPQLVNVVEDQDKERIKIGGKWVHDFGSANFLGLEHHPGMIKAAREGIDKWGLHHSRSRIVASPFPYVELERGLADFVHAPETLAFPTTTLLHLGILPILAGNDGVILLDQEAHNSIQEAAKLASTSGAKVDFFHHNDLSALEKKLDQYKDCPQKIIAVDGVYSMTCTYAPLPEMVELAKKYNARIYIDDAYGFGVIGENATEANPYGDFGNGVVNYFGLDYVKDNIIYVGGLSKCFSVLTSFITCTSMEEKMAFCRASTWIFSGPCTTVSLATGLESIKISNSQEGNDMRAHLLKTTAQLVEGGKKLGFEVDNNHLFPFVSIVIGSVNDVIKACNILWDYNVLVTPSLFPAVPIDRGLLRFTLTASNTAEDVNKALEALGKVKEMLDASKKEKAAKKEAATMLN